MEHPLGWGIIGCGDVARQHAGAIDAAEGAELRGVCDSMGDRAEAFASKNGVPSWYSDPRALLSSDDIHAVSICTPPGTHPEVAVAAAAEGKHILCEKPLAITEDGLDAMIGAAREHKVKLGVVLQRRTYSSYRHAKEAIDSGRLGRIVMADVYHKGYKEQEYFDVAPWRGTWELASGWLMGSGVHTLDTLMWLAGPVESVYARYGVYTHRIETEDVCVALLRFKNGAMGVMESSASAYGAFPLRIEVHGEKGSIGFENDVITRWGIVGEEEAVPSLDNDGSLGHRRMVEDFVAAVEEDRDPVLPGEEGRKVVDVILAAYESGRTGKEVEVR